VKFVITRGVRVFALFVIIYGDLLGNMEGELVLATNRNSIEASWKYGKRFRKFNENRGGSLRMKGLSVNGNCNNVPVLIFGPTVL